jgi:hypothetical protein
LCYIVLLYLHVLSKYSSLYKTITLIIVVKMAVFFSVIGMFVLYADYH